MIIFDKDILKKIDIFFGLDNEEIRAISKISRVKNFGKNESIFSVGDLRSDFYIIVVGSVSITNKSNQVLYLMQEGDFISEASLISDDITKHTSNATTLSDSKIICISREDFMSIFKEFPDMCFRVLSNIIRLMKDRILHLNNKLSTAHITGNIVALYGHDLNKTLDLVFDKVLEVLPVKNIFVFSFLNNSLKPLKSINTINSPISSDIVSKLVADSQFLKNVIYSADSFILNDIKRGEVSDSIFAGSEGFIITPIFSNLSDKNSIIGFIILLDKIKNKRFSINNKILLNIVADHISPVIKNNI